MSPSKRQRNILELAANVARQSDHHSHKLGAVLVRGGSVINTSCNKMQWNSFAARFVHLNKKECNDIASEHATIHAEIGAILGISKNKTYGADIYVTRVKKNGQYAMAMPCKMCQAILAQVGINRVFYTINESEIGKMTVR